MKDHSAVDIVRFNGIAVTFVLTPQALGHSNLLLNRPGSLLVFSHLLSVSPGLFSLFCLFLEFLSLLGCLCHSSSKLS